MLALISDPSRAKYARNELQFWLFGAVGMAVALSYASLVNQADFMVFYDAATKLLHGINPFPNPDSSFVFSGKAYVYPTWDLLIIAPFTLFSPHLASLIFVAASSLCYTIALRLLRGPSPLVVLTVSVMTPVLISMQMGTMTPLMFLGLAIVWRFRDSLVVAGIIVAFLATLKLFLMPVLLFFLVTKRWRTFALALLTVAVLISASFAFGPISIISYVHILLVLSAHEMSFGWSLSGVLRSLLPYSIINQALLGGLILSMLAGIIVFHNKSRDDASTFVGVVIVALLATPILWSSYLPLLLCVTLILKTTDKALALLGLFTWILVTPDLAGMQWDSTGIIVSGALVLAIYLSKNQEPLIVKSKNNRTRTWYGVFGREKLLPILGALFLLVLGFELTFKGFLPAFVVQVMLFGVFIWGRSQARSTSKLLMK